MAMPRSFVSAAASSDGTSSARAATPAATRNPAVIREPWISRAPRPSARMTPRGGSSRVAREILPAGNSGRTSLPAEAARAVDWDRFPRDARRSPPARRGVALFDGLEAPAPATIIRRPQPTPSGMFWPNRRSTSGGNSSRSPRGRSMRRCGRLGIGWIADDPQRRHARVEPESARDSTSSAHNERSLIDHSGARNPRTSRSARRGERSRARSRSSANRAGVSSYTRRCRCPCDAISCPARDDVLHEPGTARRSSRARRTCPEPDVAAGASRSVVVGDDAAGQGVPLSRRRAARRRRRRGTTPRRRRSGNCACRRRATRPARLSSMNCTMVPRCGGRAGPSVRR